MTPRGEGRRQAIIEAAAAIIRESGPSAVSHRSVAKRAGCSLSATTYYFDGLEDLLHQAGLVNIGLWASRAEDVADRVEAFKGVPDLSQRVRFILQATLPAHGAYFGHYLQLISASQASPVKHAYRQGRQRLNAALRRVLRQLDSPLEPEMVIAIVDGAAVTALSEGWKRQVDRSRTTDGSHLPGPRYAALPGARCHGGLHFDPYCSYDTARHGHVE